VISRLKIMSELDIAEKEEKNRRNGRVSVRVDETADRLASNSADQRATGATIASRPNESNAQRSLDDLGMDGSARARFETLPAAYGCGCWSPDRRLGQVERTLYARCPELKSRREDHHDEDPVELPDAGFNQMNVNRKEGSTRHRPALDPPRPIQTS